jgi:hypothetical protein
MRRTGHAPRMRPKSGPEFAPGSGGARKEGRQWT